MDDALNRCVEDACLNAWPALKEIFYDGWLIRLAEGHTRRTNSVNVLHAGVLPIAEKIAHCEQLYAAHGLPVIFRLRSTDDPALEQALASRGYRIEFLPIEVQPRLGKSTVSVATGFQTILLVLRLASLFNPLRVFLPLSLSFILLGTGWAIPYLLDGEGITVAAMLAFLTGVTLFGMGLICDQVAQLRLERHE